MLEVVSRKRRSRIHSYTEDSEVHCFLVTRAVKENSSSISGYEKTGLLNLNSVTAVDFDSVRASSLFDWCFVTPPSKLGCRTIFEITDRWSAVNENYIVTASKKVRTSERIKYSFWSSFLTESQPCNFAKKSSIYRFYALLEATRQSHQAPVMGGTHECFYSA